MKYIFLLLFIIFNYGCSSRSGGLDVCKMLKMDNCNNSKRSLNRSAGASLPSVNAAAFSNPAAISLSRGLGIESIHYGGFAQFGLVTGTGRIGAAISNFPNDGTFFGNTAVESSYSSRLRYVDRLPYDGDKFVLASGFNLFGGKKKTGLQADIGLMYRRQTELEEDYFGGGLTLSFNRIISIGYATYNDIFYEDLRGKLVDVVNNNGTVTENVYFPIDNLYLYQTDVKVESYTAGLKFSKFALDYVKFVSLFSNQTSNFAIDQTESNIYNLSYFYTTWIFSYGRRWEKSFREIVDEDGNFKNQNEKWDSFLGAQYATSNGFLLGAFINYYLQDDLSLGVTYFF